ncbi:glutamine-hydrolyzing carbamoyl-phosphate synthase small subunit [Desulfofundulus thermocisternus]|uniref:glutamine-hydrolyzing carbamoyl-phosphate synthase small subunit n=1 Tax=Desulfofundulus thermocisternus TaxID=42471 RepID=UPI001A0E4E54|nr:glutamine-hydrolyzing carbamoyl-phosphate synthase small subunit [Desulfofundulus thermocisternus]MBE3585151.1 glutamine-hydrolyzing carbamoyl-phosphate synthase small subunit [Thermoanaerobacter sp.]MCS5695995.1 glutamine-hydrolyzing carbamoyl-phosphate synthase small subunit [Desulfofundulus thermocisternus]MDK2888279.1 carbamoyl-phosphate synthase small subunit [Thermoanaerobacter sp.]
MQAILALEDGTVFSGRAFGARGERWGEVVFNTAMTGYQEILTDPSYCGQIVVMTYPLIGNYGINREDFESKKSFVRGFVVREECDRPSNWRASYRLSDFLAREGVVGISGIDTRALTRHLRNRGTMRGVLSTECDDPALLVEKARQCPHLTGQELVLEVATKEVFTLEGKGYRVILIDLGSKLNIIRHLQERDCEIVVVPPTATAREIMALEPDGILLSNGPGDPMDVPYTIKTIKELIGQRPIFGICLGHQVIALALGARTYKMKFGHRGANHPVKDLGTGRIYITSQNHGFAVADDSLAGLPVEISHRNLNDGTVEGIRHRELPVFSVQYHPEASPGPRESAYLFDEFIQLMQRRK